MLRLVRVATLAAAALGIGALLARLVGELRRQSRPAARTPAAFLRGGRRPSTRTLVVCAGDSITRGFASAAYVDMLAERLGPAGYEFVNAGINANLAHNVAVRLDDIIACSPDVVTLLVGTNDVNATFSQAWEDTYRKEQHLPAKPTLDFYRQSVETILDRLSSETSARVAILDLPMLGEDLSSEMNRRAVECNAALRATANERRVPCLPLHERLAALVPPDHAPPPYEGSKSLIYRATLQHHLLRRSWDSISADHGLRILTDHIHLNETGARVLADLIAAFAVQGADEAPPPAPTAV